MTRLHRTVLFSASGGLFTVLALLGSPEAHAAPQPPKNQVPDFRAGEMRPGSARKKAPAPAAKGKPAQRKAEKPAAAKQVQLVRKAAGAGANAKPASPVVRSARQGAKPKKTVVNKNAPAQRSATRKPSAAAKKQVAVKQGVAAGAKPQPSGQSQRQRGRGRSAPKPAEVKQKETPKPSGQPEQREQRRKEAKSASVKYRAPAKEGASAGVTHTFSKQPNELTRQAQREGAVKKGAATGLRAGTGKPTRSERKSGQPQAIAAAKQAAATAAARGLRPKSASGQQNKNGAIQAVQKVQGVTSRVLAALPQTARKLQDLPQRVADQAQRQAQERDRRLRDLAAQAPARAAYAESQRGGAPGSTAAKKERDRALREVQATAPGRAAYANSQRGGAPGRAARDQRVRIAQGQVDYNDALRGQPVGERTAEIVETVGPDKIRVTNGRTGRSAVHNIPLSGYVRPATSFQADLVGSAATGPTISFNEEVKVQEWRPVPGGQHPGVSVGTTAEGSVVAVSTGKLPDDVARQLNTGGRMEAGHSTADGRNVTVYRPPTQYEANVKDLAKQWSEVAPNGAVDGKQLGQAVAGTGAILADGAAFQQGNFYGSGKDCAGKGQNCGELGLEAGLALIPLKGVGGVLKGVTGVARGTEAVGKAVLPKAAPRTAPVPRIPTNPARPGTSPTAPEGPRITPRIPRPPWPTEDPDTAQPQPGVPDKPMPQPVPAPGPRETPWQPPRPVEPHPQQTPPGVPRPDKPAPDPEEAPRVAPGPVKPVPGPGDTPQVVPQPDRPAPSPAKTPWGVPRPDLPGKPVAPTAPRPLPHPGERDKPETNPDFDDPGRPATLPDPEIPAFPRTAPQPHTDNPRPQPYHRSAEQPEKADPDREPTRPGDSRAESGETPRTGKGNPSGTPENLPGDPGKNDSCSRRVRKAPVGACRVNGAPHGKLGEAATLRRLQAEGYANITSEVRFVTSGGTEFRADFVAQEADGSWIAVEAKTGRGARLTPGQEAGYPQLNSFGAIVDTSKLAQFGMPKGTAVIMEVEFDLWECPVCGS